MEPGSSARAVGALNRYSPSLQPLSLLWWLPTHRLQEVRSLRPQGLTQSSKQAWGVVSGPLGSPGEGVQLSPLLLSPPASPTAALRVGVPAAAWRGGGRGAGRGGRPGEEAARARPAKGAGVRGATRPRGHSCAGRSRAAGSPRRRSRHAAHRPGSAESPCSRLGQRRPGRSSVRWDPRPGEKASSTVPGPERDRGLRPTV